MAKTVLEITILIIRHVFHHGSANVSQAARMN